MGGHISMMYAALTPMTSRVSGCSIRVESGARREVNLGRSSSKPAKIHSWPEVKMNSQDIHVCHGGSSVYSASILNVMAQERIKNYDLEKRIFKELTSDSAESYVKGLKTPTLIVFGDKDRAIHPATADILHKLIPNSEVIIMKGSVTCR